ncbi:hypothetical protein L2E82_39838 [Cichorium intybus]|uniref:Uncharacterized protein n=1 Tax=Cichorium intybus TaxID=13427 RepID=A0ACB9ANQ1_CICIN|nr:hypothetical protein L2E82_39838 [Cichorium intybus]
MDDRIGSTICYVTILHIVVLGISYWQMNKDVDDSIVGSLFDLLKSLSSIHFSMENAVIGFCIAFVLAAIVIGVASFSSERNPYRVWRYLLWLVVVLFATSIWILAINAMGYLLVL